MPMNGQDMVDIWTVLQAAAGVLIGLIVIVGALAISVLREQGRGRLLTFFGSSDLGSIHPADSYCNTGGYWAAGSAGCGGGGGDCGGGDGQRQPLALLTWEPLSPASHCRFGSDLCRTAGDGGVPLPLK